MLSWSLSTWHPPWLLPEDGTRAYTWNSSISEENALSRAYTSNSSISEENALTTDLHDDVTPSGAPSTCINLLTSLSKIACNACLREMVSSTHLLALLTCESSGLSFLTSSWITLFWIGLRSYQCQIQKTDLCNFFLNCWRGLSRI